MKIKIYSYFFFIPGLMCFAQITAEELLLKALAAHGGNHYKEVKSITYQKKINHFDASGAVLDTVIENHTIDFVNSTSQFSWKEPGNDFIAIQNKDSVTLQINGVHTKDTSAILKIKKSLKAATYVFWQPFKLVDPNAILELKGVTTLFNGWQVHVLEVQYPNSDDRWYFYFDTKSFLLKATGVFFNKRYSLIVNELLEKYTGLNLNAKRTSYFTNSSFVPKRINTQYQYEVISLIK
jgi:hypothetical protein